MPIQTGARSGTPSSVATVPWELPCRSQIPRLAWLLEVTCQAAKTPPDGAAAGKLPPWTSSRIGVPCVLISQMSVVAFGAGGPDTVAVADGLADDPTPGCPAGRVTSSWPAGVQLPLKTVPASASRLSWP